MLTEVLLVSANIRWRNGVISQFLSCFAKISVCHTRRNLCLARNRSDLRAVHYWSLKAGPCARMSTHKKQIIHKKRTSAKGEEEVNDKVKLRETLNNRRKNIVVFESVLWMIKTPSLLIYRIKTWLLWKHAKRAIFWKWKRFLTKDILMSICRIKR